MSTNHFIKLENFEGPLDLLLHLIKLNELDIFTVNLYQLTSQYLEYLRLVNFKDIKDAASFMEMAATLIALKARDILPDAKDTEETQGEEDEGGVEDLTESLRKRLLQYQLITAASQHLLNIQGSLDCTETNHEHERLKETYEDVVSPLIGDSVVLLVMYEQLLATLTERMPVRVKTTTETIALEKVIDGLKAMVEGLDTLLFQSLHPKINNRYELVAYILAMLQLVRDGKMKIHQEDLHGALWMYTNTLDLPQFNTEVAKSSSKSLAMGHNQDPREILW